MTTAFPHQHFSLRIRGMAIVAILVASLGNPNALAQAPAAPAPAGAAQTPGEQLEKLVARIALYPDDLVAIILPSATNPLQIVQADRFLEKRKADPKLKIDDKWDNAVKSLINYPEVIKSMSNDLDWTAALGEAVVANQGAVLEAVQAFRRKTQSAGNLKSDAKQVIVIEKEIIKIVPADPQVIYVPQYNPTTVVIYGGYSSWGYYPVPYPSYYYPYPPGAALATGLIWGAAIGAAWNGGHYGCHYGGGNNNININHNTNINTGNINTGNINRGGGAGQRPTSGTTAWNSNKQPGQVSSTVGKSSSSRPGNASAGGGSFGASAGSSNRSAGAGGASNRSTSAFSGSGSGHQASMNSSRGASSRSSMSTSSFSGGGSRSGGSRGGGGRRR